MHFRMIDSPIHTPPPSPRDSEIREEEDIAAEASQPLGPEAAECLQVREHGGCRECGASGRAGLREAGRPVCAMGGVVHVGGESGARYGIHHTQRRRVSKGPGAATQARKAAHMDVEMSVPNREGEVVLCPERYPGNWAKARGTTLGSEPRQVQEKHRTIPLGHSSLGGESSCSLQSSRSLGASCGQCIRCAVCADIWQGQRRFRVGSGGNGEAQNCSVGGIGSGTGCATP